jgi:hypothetical protein
MKKYILIITVLLFASCSKDGLPNTVKIERTIVVYMAADNDMSFDAFDDIEEMKQFFSGTGTNLIVFIDPAKEAPYILKIAQDAETKVKTYPEFNSVDASQVQQVLNDIINMYPAESYGLILWSHGTSWLPANVRLKSFGQDDGKQINIPELADALPIRFDFILFDACLMGAVEVAYELRNKTDYIISSSAEIIYIGFPYDLIIPELLSSTPNLKKAAESCFNYYNEQENKVYRSATMSLIDTKELDNLAQITNQLLSEHTFDISSFDRTSVQCLDVYEEQYTFDFLDFVTKASPKADKRLLIEQLAKTVLYKAHTAKFLEEYDINTYCGLSCYIPHNNREDLNLYYKQLRWYQAGGYNKLF